MPYPNEHAAPQREASSKDAKIRRYTPETWPEGVHGVWEIDARNNLRLLSVRFKAALWTAAAARAWLEEHEMSAEGFEPATEGPEVKMTEPLLLAEGVDRAPLVPVPEGLTLGRSFATLAVGKVRSRLSGDAIVEVSLEDIYELARVFGERAHHDPVPLDWNHTSSPSNRDSGDPSRGGALGRVVGAFVEAERLYVTPAYTPKGLEVLEQYRGVLSSSPEFVLGEVYDRGAEEPVLIGRAQLLAVALTCRPAQVASKIDHVTLTEAAAAAGHQKEVLMKDGEEKGECPRCGAMLAELEALREKCGAYERKMADAEVKASEGAQKATLAEKLGGEVKTLAEQVKALAERAEKAEAAQHRAENEAEAQAYLADGRIAPSEKDAFVAALNERRAGRAMFFEHTFKSRKAGHAVALGEQGHSAPVKTGDDDSLEAHKRIEGVAKEKFGGDYRAAYKHLTETDSETRRLLGMKGN